MNYSYGGYHPKLASSVYIAPGVHLIGNITIGEHSSVWFNAVLRGDNAPVIVGERTNIQDGCVLHVDTDKPLSIGNEVTIGHNAVLHGCTIQNGALIGMGSIILNDAIIGEQALIAAGSLIPQGKKIPPRTLIMGNPGKIVRELTENELEKLRDSSRHYVTRSKEFMEYMLG